MAGEDLRVRANLVIPASELRESASRSRGPGGQNVNKTSTRVTLRWRATESESLTDTQRRRLVSKLGARLAKSGDLVVHCDRTRSRARNREHARERLAEIVREALRVRARRRPTRPTAASERRRRDAKQRRSATKRRRASVSPDPD